MMPPTWLNAIPDLLRQLIAERSRLTLPPGEFDKELAEVLGKLESPRREIGVVGVQGHGKSTLVNALLDRDLVYTGAQIATNRLIRIGHGSPRLEVIRRADGKDPTVERFPIADLKEMGRRGGSLDPPPGSEVIAFCDSEFLRDGVWLVDTPGESAGAGASGDDACVSAYLRDSAVLLVAANAAKPGLENVLRLVQRAGRKSTGIVVALTAVDVLDDDELEEAVTSTRGQLATVGLDHVPIFPVAALKALSPGPSDAAYTKEIEQLRRHLRGLALRPESGLLVLSASAVARAAEGWRKQWAEAIQVSAASVEQLKADQRREERLAQETCDRLEGVRRAIAGLEPEWQARVDGSLAEGPHDAAASIEEFVHFHDIRAINRELQSRVSCEMHKLVSDCEERLLRTVSDLTEEWTHVLEAVDPLLALDPPGSLNYRLPTLTVNPQPEGVLAWLDDRDDTKRKDQAVRGAASALSSAFTQFSGEMRASAVRHVQDLRALCFNAIDGKVAEAHAPVQAVLESVAGAESGRRSLENELARLDDLTGEAAAGIEAACSAAVLTELAYADCSVAVPFAADSLRAGPTRAGNFVDLCRDLDALPRRLSSPEPTLVSHWAHLYAGVFYLKSGRTAEAMNQAHLAAVMQDAVGPDDLLRGAKLFLDGLTRCADPKAVLDYLEDHALRDALTTQRIAAGLLAGDLPYVERLLASPQARDIDGGLAALARYACGEPMPGPIPDNCQGLSVLSDCHISLSADSDVSRMVDALAADASVERHVIARLSGEVVLSADEAQLVDRAYGEITPFEYALPASSRATLGAALTIGEG